MYGIYGKCELRRVFQIDGIDGGVLSIAEKPQEGRAILVISNGEAEARIALTREDFAEIAKLKDELRFSYPKAPVAEPWRHERRAVAGWQSRGGPLVPSNTQSPGG